MEGVKSVLFNSRAMLPYLSDIPPDDFKISPPKRHVLCRDAEGNPTAVYGDDVWDLNPYRLSASPIRLISFTSWVDCKDLNFSATLVQESKFILYILMYLSGNGRAGKLSASTLVQYWFFLRKLSEFCVRSLANDLAKGISIFDVLSNSSYLLAFVQGTDVPKNQKKMLSSLLSFLNRIDPTILGFVSCPRHIFDWTRTEDQQHPVIPSRIYVEIMNHYEKLIEGLIPHKSGIKSLILSLHDRSFGLAISTQEQNSYGIPNVCFKPTMEELIKEHGLETLLYETFPISYPTRQSFGTWLLRVQYLLKNIIHLYTGMRHEECLRLQYSCVSKQEMTEPTIDEKGVAIEGPRIVSIVSSTTKYSGYKRKGSWLAPDNALFAIQILRSICEGLSSLYGMNPSDCPLFISPTIIRSPRAKFRSTFFENGRARGADSVLSQQAFRITKRDLKELEQSDPDRNFYEEPEFGEGEYWPLTSHQFRRSLAFYAANSGFVSLGTVSSQFKHVAKSMTQYYSRNYENLLTVFGDWSEERQAYLIGQNHISQEFQMAVPTNSVTTFFRDVFESDSTLLGGTGSYLEKQKRKVGDGEISILEAKQETMKMAANGEFSYRKTLLGGCTKVGTCNEFMLGDLTACLSCEGANIRHDMLDERIEEAEIEMNSYPLDSAEHQISKMELTRMMDFRRTKLSKGEAQ